MELEIQLTGVMAAHTWTANFSYCILLGGI